LEPVSASNRFTFELLADYNTAALLEHKAHKKMEKTAAGAEDGHQQGAPHLTKHPAGAPGAVGGGPARPAFSSPNRAPLNHSPNFNPNPNRMPNPSRNANPNPNPKQGGPR
jgi:hypothetical protein